MYDDITGLTFLVIDITVKDTCIYCIIFEVNQARGKGNFQIYGPSKLTNHSVRTN